MDYKQVGKRIREARKQHTPKMTQKELGIQIGGKSESLIAKYEHGNVNIPIATMQKIASVLGVPITQLIGEDSGVTNNRDAVQEAAHSTLEAFNTVINTFITERMKNNGPAHEFLSGIANGCEHISARYVYAIDNREILAALPKVEGVSALTELIATGKIIGDVT